MGDVVTGQVMTAVALNGRSFTDLLSLQPGIVPMSTQTPDSVVMAGVTVAITPSGSSESREPIHQRAAGRCQRISGKRIRRQGVDERRHRDHSESGFYFRIPGADQQFRRGIRQLCRRHRERGDPESEQTRFTATSSSSCATPISMRRTSLPRIETPINKINSAARSVARSKRTRSSFLEIIKEPGPSKVWRPAMIPVPRLPSSSRQSLHGANSRIWLTAGSITCACGYARGGLGGSASKFVELPRFFRRAVFHAGMHQCHVRVSERHHPAERLDGSGPASIAIYSAAQCRPKHVLRRGR